MMGEKRAEHFVKRSWTDVESCYWREKKGNVSNSSSSKWNVQPSGVWDLVLLGYSLAGYAAAKNPLNFLVARKR